MPSKLSLEGVAAKQWHAFAQVYEARTKGVKAILVMINLFK